MKLSEYEKCPKCGCTGTVFCGHDYGDNSYNIHCYKCGLTTGKFDTYKKAQKEWERIKNDLENNNNSASYI